MFDYLAAIQKRLDERQVFGDDRLYLEVRAAAGPMLSTYNTGSTTTHTSTATPATDRPCLLSWPPVPGAFATSAIVAYKH